MPEDIDAVLIKLHRDMKRMEQSWTASLEDIKACCRQDTTAAEMSLRTNRPLFSGETSSEREAAIGQAVFAYLRRGPGDCPVS
jgi:hypothetical protein